MHKINFALILSGLAAGVVLPLAAQELAPRAYVITPLHANVVTLTWGFYTGGRPRLQRHDPHIRRYRDVQRPRLQLLPFIELLRAFRKHHGLAAVRRGNLLGDSAWESNVGLPLCVARRVLPLLGKPEGRASHGTSTVSPMEAEDLTRCQRESDCTDRAIQPHQAD